MRPSYALRAMMLLGGLTGCSSSPTDTSGTEYVASGVEPSARAETFTVSQFFQVDVGTFVPCANGGAGETVDLSGVLHDLFHVTINGNRFVLKTHTQPQGISGVGQISGDVYRGTGVTQETFTAGVVGITDNLVNNFKIIGPGRGNNFLVHENFHFTVNANGTLTVLRDHLTAECK
jgi:hypothetical protein